MSGPVNSVAYHLDPLPDPAGRGGDGPAAMPGGDHAGGLLRPVLFGLTARSQTPPEPGPDQIVVRVRAASLNRRDLLLMDGTYPLPAAAGVVPLSDGVGEVITMGERVTRVAVGDRVTSTYFLNWIDGPQRLSQVREQFGVNHDGWLARHIVLNQESAVRVPEHLTNPEAASLTCAGVVAWAALTKPVPVEPGGIVLTVGTGTVALFAVQFARMHGARVISVTSSPEKAKRLRALGADETIDRTETPDWERAVLDLTDGDGADHIIDAVGLPTLSKSVAAGAFNAQVTLIGAFPGGKPTTNPFGGAYLSIRRIAVGSRTDFEAMNRAIAEHGTRPVIDRVFRFDEAVDAYRYVRDGNPFGKVVIQH
ncbi:NAD(P)-dependent alcohol dehydrogenase [Streptomyces sp. NPDC056154]|uniref:zinc-dependent alcohol dehydrogenase family protein n=1 Tax=unclassified Streptomyces TaxID=2593676 RepID=UPI0035D58816